MLDGNFIDAYAVLDARQDPQAIDAILDSPRTIDVPAGLDPPGPDCPPSVMLKYLTRYLTGGPISDRRIVGERDGRIYFTARSKRKAEGPVEVSLSRVEFVRQWSLHIPPKGVRSQARASQAMPSLPRGDAMHREGGTSAGRSVRLFRLAKLEDKFP